MHSSVKEHSSLVCSVCENQLPCYFGLGSHHVILQIFFFFFFAHEQWTKFSFFSLEQASDLYHRLIVVHTESLQTNTKGHKPLLLVEKEIYGNK